MQVGVMIYAVAIAATTAALVSAQGKLTQYGGHTDRGSTRVAYWDNEKNEAAGQVAIDFGRPVWKPEYEAQLDAMTRGKIWRMGDNFWTSLDANVPVTIGGVEVPPRYYYLAVKRSEDGSAWSLAFVDPAGTRKHVLDAFEVGTRPALLPVELEAPLAFEALSAPVEKLVIELTEESLSIRWGSFALSAPVTVKPR